MDSYTKIAGRFLRHGLVAGMLLLTSTAAQASFLGGGVVPPGSFSACDNPFLTRPASLSFCLNQSNALPDGTNYLQVTLTDNGSGVDFLVQTLDPLNDIAGRHFGIQKFGFNFTSNTPYEITGLPDYWRVKKDKQMSEFGRYDIRLQGKGKARTDELRELSFTVGGVSLGDFDSLFAAHVAGFEWCKTDDEERNKKRRWCGDRDCVTSAYFAGNMSVSEVPVPAAAWLFGSGLLGLIGVARRHSIASRDFIFR